MVKKVSLAVAIAAALAALLWAVRSPGALADTAGAEPRADIFIPQR